MKRIASFAVALFMFASALPAGAQTTILESAERLVAARFQQDAPAAPAAPAEGQQRVLSPEEEESRERPAQPAQPAQPAGRPAGQQASPEEEDRRARAAAPRIRYRRSMARTWIGVGMIAGGLTMAFAPLKALDTCGLTGSLNEGDEYYYYDIDRDRFGRPVGFLAAHSPHNAVATEISSNCEVDYDVQVQGAGTYGDFNNTETIGRGNFAYDHFIGTAKAESVRRPEYYWGGIALAATGAAFALLFSDVMEEIPVARDIRVGVVPGRFTVGSSFGF